MEQKKLQVWDLWYPKAGATGMPFARGRMDPTDVLYVHAAPDSLSVQVRISDCTLVAQGENLKRTLPHYTPIIKSWWHAPDYSEWRWLVEFYNHR